MLSKRSKRQFSYFAVAHSVAVVTVKAFYMFREFKFFNDIIKMFLVYINVHQFFSWQVKLYSNVGQSKMHYEDNDDLKYNYYA